MISGCYGICYYGQINGFTDLRNGESRQCALMV